jgi:hypothetical protein
LASQFGGRVRPIVSRPFSVVTTYSLSPSIQPCRILYKSVLSWRTHVSACGDICYPTFHESRNDQSTAIVRVRKSGYIQSLNRTSSNAISGYMGFCRYYAPSVITMTELDLAETLAGELLATVEHKRRVKREQMRRYREKKKQHATPNRPQGNPTLLGQDNNERNTNC